ncbi:hypothetical protein [Paenibacillus sp. YIM B09110]
MKIALGQPQADESNSFAGASLLLERRAREEAFTGLTERRFSC